ncbi:hypothetical protein DF185_18655 [Marinifilum breve]|uniref:histidine kinase n=1 Tax=Marinifilum breve TaxID=2184082 RepID=A0A2V3ZWU9_9BACT|nr:ATP-binding protein [Marinifilum breve]PXX97046.1 hypothetical protein DF185_18655 [Marinifilum breve]
MKKFIIIFLSIMLLFSCNEGKEEESKKSVEYFNKAKKVASTSIDSCLYYLEKAIEYTKEEGDSLFRLKLGYHKGKTIADIDYRKSNKIYKDLLPASKELKEVNIECNILTNIGANYCYNGEIDSSEFYFNKALELKKQVNNKATINRLNFFLGTLYLGKNEYQKAINFYSKVEEYADSIGHQGMIMSCQSNFAICYERLGNMNKSAECGLFVLSHYEENNYPIEKIALIRSNLFNALNSTLNDQEILEFTNETLKISKESKSARVLCMAYQRSAIVNHERLKNFELALEYYKKAESYAYEGGLKHEIAALVSNQGSVYLDMKQYQKSLDLINKALEISIKNKDNRRISLNYNLKAEILMEQNKYKAAEKYLILALGYGSNLERKKITYENLVEVYKHLKRHKVLAETFESLREVNNKIQKENKDQVIQNLKSKYETEKKEQQIQLLEANNQNQKLSLEKAEQERKMMFAGLGLLVLLVVPVGFYARQRNQNKVLEARINSENKECTRIAKELHDSVSGSLTTIRYLLESGTEGNSLVENIESVSKEVRGISHKLNMSALANQGIKEAVYDALMLNQFPKDIQLAINMPEGFEVKDFEVKINFIRILQELVQNTIKYAEASSVEISFEQEKQSIVLTYQDNGKGCDMEQISLGNGLRNIKDRVKYIKGTLEFDSQPDNGFYCCIKI